MLSDKEFRQLLHYFDRPWSGYRKIRKGVKKRIRRHMDETDCRAIDAYIDHLQMEPEEKAVCEQHLLVTISRFFRDARLWAFLQEYLLPELIRRFDGPCRIWSVGCANGEEPYSLSIIWCSVSESSMVEILATDTRMDCLNRAQKGLYSRSSLKEVPDDIRSEYFLSVRSGRNFSVRKDKIIPIQWQRHNLFDPPPKGTFHLIFLRNNLLTYHQGIQLRTAFEKIMSVLYPGGYLVVGSHETLPPSSVKLIRNEQCPWVYKKEKIQPSIS